MLPWWQIKLPNAASCFSGGKSIHFAIRHADRHDFARRERKIVQPVAQVAQSGRHSLCRQRLLFPGRSPVGQAQRLDIVNRHEQNISIVNARGDERVAPAMLPLQLPALHSPGNGVRRIPAVSGRLDHPR